MIVRVFVSGNGFSHWQLIMDEFDEKGAINVVFVESLTMGFPVDRFHVIEGPMISFHNVVANSRAKCLAAYGVAVSGGNGLSAAMELGCIAGESGNGFRDDVDCVNLRRGAHLMRSEALTKFDL